MAYRRYTRKSTSYRARRRTVRSARRSPYTKRRRYVRRSLPSRRMTTRKVLEIASTKKRDNMALYDPNNTTNQFIVAGFGQTSYLYCATARSKNTGLPTENDREHSSVYMKGYREMIEMSPNSGTTWKWRRIVFETKGIQDSTTYQFTSNGYRRIFRSQTGAGLIATASTVLEGEIGPDHSGVFTGKVDTNRVKLHSDVTRIMRAGNQSAHHHQYKVYYPMNRNFNYNDDEAGGSESTAPFATTGNHGMGDIYIWDIIQDVGGVPSDGVTIRCDGTLYWHEK
ncbi:capsid protein [Gemyduguivirus recro1]|uniref:Capsid protein n=1 Tax=Gemycircularvirus sp. TaxID=1983771 RepID=A0A2K9YNC0_9VIRU|nr:capsid protein [Gemycircularvirus sp.]AUW34336.1 capsid protein [Gemycircularvirus sp.]